MIWYDSIQSSPLFIYLHADSTAQWPIAKTAHVHVNNKTNQNKGEVQDKTDAEDSSKFYFRSTFKRRARKKDYYYTLLQVQ